MIKQTKQKWISSRGIKRSREINDLLCFWRFCSNAKCLRSRSCRGDVMRCELHWRFLSAGEKSWYDRRVDRLNRLR